MTTPLRERFGIPLRLIFYTPAELRGSSCAAPALLGCRSRATARGDRRKVARHAARRDPAAAPGARLRPSPACRRRRGVADAALTRLEVDGRGLDAMDRRYLRCIAENYGGGPVGVETLAAALAEQRDVIEDVIEPYLIQQGLLQRTPRGRLLSEGGYRHIGLAMPKGQKQQLDLLAAGNPPEDA
jgi:Holliday junction DNA helicase RuvB